MRPTADISHSLNGRVKDLAEELDVSLQEAYKRVIERGVDEMEDELQ
jgi:predicted DNA-binding protein